jgi:4-hydroxybenzoate polyprenyltransferase
VHAVFEFHRAWAWVAIVVNGLVGVAALVAWRVERLRGGWVWAATLVAGAVMLLQVALGVTLQASKQYKAPDFHIFYGILAFLSVTLAYNYRRQLRRRLELSCGLLDLFVMGLGIRALLQVHG